MASLLGLPNEILNQIIDDVPPDDIENFAATCQRLRDLAAAALMIHCERKRKYTDLNFFACYRHAGAAENHPIMLFDEIYKDNKVASYPKSLGILCCDKYDDERDSFNQDESDIARRVTAKLDFSTMLQPYLGTSYRVKSSTNYCEDIQKGGRALLLALLLTQLRNLETVSISKYGSHGHGLHFLQAVCMLANHGPENLEPNPLSNLRTVNLSEPDLSLSSLNDLSILTLFPQLGAVRSLNVYRFGEASSQDFSNVKDLTLQEINFYKSRLDSSLLSSLIGTTTALKRFSFEYRDVQDLRSPQIDAIIESLLTNAKHTLTDLSLSDLPENFVRASSRIPHTYQGSLRGFEVLRRINLPHQLYISDKEANSISARGTNVPSDRCKRKILPESIETAEFNSEGLISSMGGIIMDVADHKKAGLPRLTKMTFHLPNKSREMADYCLRRCRCSPKDAGLRVHINWVDEDDWF